MIPGFDTNESHPLRDGAAAKAAGKRFVYIRASQGTVTDREWASSVTAARLAGLRWGAYHALLRVDPAGQARYFHNLTQGEGLVPWVDFEVAGVTLADLWEWLDEYSDLSGRLACVYTRAGFWNPLAQANPELAGEIANRAGLAVASYRDDRPTLPISWPTWVFWQHSNNGTVPGVPPPTDLDWFNGDEAELDRLGETEPEEPMPDIERARELLGQVMDLTVQISEALGDGPAPQPVTPFRWPTNDAQRRVTQGFGANVAHYAPLGLPFGHEGVDLVAPRGTPITAVANGKITRVDLNHNAYGLSVRQSCVVEGHTFEVCYGHGQTGSLAVKLNDVITAGQLLFLSDATGSVFGSSADLSHLHIHLREPGVTWVDAEGHAWPFNVRDISPFLGLG